jgi:hypothetical protein
VNGTLTELKRLLPPAKVEYVEKQPTLEEVFFAIVGDDGGGVEGKDRDGLATSIAPLAALPPRESRLLSAPTSSSLSDQKACPLAPPQHGAGRDPGTAASQQMTKEQR